MTEHSPGHYLHDHYGPYTIEFDHEQTILTFQALPKHLNLAGSVHGGVLLFMADTVMSVAAVQAQKQPVVTLSMNSQFIAPAFCEQSIRAIASVTAARRTVAFVSCRLCVEDQIIFTASGVWKTFKAPTTN